jgi:hypothetical protein
MLQLLAPRLVRGDLELTLHLGAGEPERLHLPVTLGIATLRRLTGFPLLLLPLFHSLGQTRLRVDEPFSGITHAHIRLRPRRLPFATRLIAAAAASSGSHVLDRTDGHRSSRSAE